MMLAMTEALSGSVAAGVPHPRRTRADVKVAKPHSRFEFPTAGLFGPRVDDVGHSGAPFRGY